MIGSVQSKRVGMDKRPKSSRILWLVGGILILGAAGCRDMVGDVPSAKQFKGPKPQIVTNDAKAGIVVPQGDLSLVTKDVVSLKVTPRPDPFALQQQENLYEAKQNNERIFATEGSFFTSLFVPKQDTVFIAQSEPQPFRRLAGVLVGDSVMAIIDMGNGSPMQVIRPGMQIPNSPWKVVSIDQDKAVLRRSGNVKPKEVVVRLQSPSFGGFQPGQGGAGAPGSPGGGNPGGGRGGKFGNGGGGGGGGSIN